MENIIKINANRRSTSFAPHDRIVFIHVEESFIKPLFDRRVAEGLCKFCEKYIECSLFGKSGGIFKSSGTYNSYGGDAYFCSEFLEAK